MAPTNQGADPTLDFLKAWVTSPELEVWLEQALAQGEGRTFRHPGLSTHQLELVRLVKPMDYRLILWSLNGQWRGIKLAGGSDVATLINGALETLVRIESYPTLYPRVLLQAVLSKLDDLELAGQPPSFWWIGHDGELVYDDERPEDLPYISVDAPHGYVAFGEVLVDCLVRGSVSSLYHEVNTLYQLKSVLTDLIKVLD